MQGSKLLDVLLSFSNKELNDLGDFLQSPYFNNNKEITQLYVIIKTKLFSKKDRQEIDFSKEKIFLELFQSNPIEEKNVSYMMNHLLKLIEKFLATEQFLNDKHDVNIKTIDAYLQRSLYKHFNYLLHRSKSEIELRPYDNENLLHQQYDLAMLTYRHFQQLNIRKSDPCVQDVVDKFDIYFIYEKLKFNVELRNRQQSLYEKYNFNFIEEVKGYIHKSDIAKVPQINIYYNLLILFEEEEMEKNQTLYNHLKEIINNNIGIISVEEMRSIFKNIINFLIRKVNKIEKLYYFEELEYWYSAGLRLKILFEKDHLSPWAFKNYVTTGLRLGKFDETERNIHLYGKLLAPDLRDNAMNINLGILNFYKKDYDASLKYLSKVEFTDIFYNLDTKRITMKIFYETKQYDVLMSHIVSFKMFLRRNETVTPAYRELYNNFTDVLAIISKQEKKKKQAILNKIKSYKSIADRDWLLQKVNEW